MDMGLTKGTKVYVRKVAPLGDPMELTSPQLRSQRPKADRRNDRKLSEF